jgi:hypothetical protein
MQNLGNIYDPEKDVKKVDWCQISIICLKKALDFHLEVNYFA